MTRDQFEPKTPCGDCPYRRDAPLGQWSHEEFIDLEKSDMDPLSPMYGCHKKDGTICRGWVIDQREREREMPNIQLRLTERIIPGAHEKIERMHCPVPRWPSIRVMAQANGVRDMTLHGLTERVALARENIDVDPEDAQSLAAACDAWHSVASTVPEHVLTTYWADLRMAIDDGGPEGCVADDPVEL